MRASGVMTFIANHDGVVYEKDLGKETAKIAKAMTKFNPDKTWRKWRSTHKNNRGESERMERKSER